jgi:hypothetical protein
MTTVNKYLPVDSQGVAAKHERVVLDVSQQEAALISLLLGRTPCTGPGGELYNALGVFFPTEGTGIDATPRSRASRAIPFIDNRRSDVLAYLGQFPGD